MSWIKKAVLALAAAALLAAAAVESFSLLLLCVATREPLPSSGVLAEQTGILYNPGVFFTNRPQEMPGFMRAEVIHPYTGSVPEGPTLQDPYGLGNAVDPVQKRSPKKLIVGVFGGSVGYLTFNHGGDILKRELRKLPGAQGKEIVLLRLAVPGYKQPQQLMLLSYLSTLGAQFDVVINIDGFNVVSLPIAENVPKNTFPAFPRSWHLRTQPIPSPALLKNLALQATVIDVRKGLASAASRRPWRYSYTAAFLWRCSDRLLQSWLGRIRSRALSQVAGPQAYAARGPRRLFSDQNELYEHLAQIWANASLLMAAASRANGAQYFHILQPNQYFAGSKKLNREELKNAFLESSPFKPGAETGYPYLVRASRTLVEGGVKYHDLTQLFSGRSETIYNDDCCHYNEHGFKLFTSAIAAAVKKDWDKR